MSTHERPTVLVDMDGVLADFDAEAIARLQERHPNIPLLDTRINFYLSDDYPAHKKKYGQFQMSLAFLRHFRWWTAHSKAGNGL